MRLQVLFEPEARDELRAARDWYEDAQPGLGEDLIVEVETTIERIVRWPELAPRLLVPERSRPVRRAPLRRFPFGLVYVVIEDTLWVLAVAHSRRRPYYWRDCLSP
ncbi:MULTISPECIES: type II toxin-antitoxin system RelE/ParE family toxin [unclassified Nocardioides]|uniref:type II toxin-antitoxin system RelE/ParE family toxin n=1 Tax=unclassified Nocardioides TaxID=2615069 RepID=UPI00188601DD|nr:MULTISPECIES: type II toxin-antitoxin system RelE/ParE family toxin [unclassified Nocardioides]